MNNNSFIMHFKALIIFISLSLIQGCGNNSPKDGTDGINGVDSNPFYPIQLCSKCTAHYPDVFPEVVFCFQGDLYGTYSANGGFSAPLPPGNYSSSGINCNCSVTLATGCRILQ